MVITAVAASSSGNESFADPKPPGAFIVFSLTPMALWLLTVGTLTFFLIGVMMLVLVWLTLTQGTKRHQAFMATLHLRFEKEKLATELEAQRDTIAVAAQAKTRFLAAASHDLRQPVQALSIFLELLSHEKMLSQEGKLLLERAQQAGGSINHLLDNLLDISKLDAQVTQVQRRPFQLGPLLHQLENEFAPVAREKGLRFHVRACRATVDSDPVLLERALRNLISNALRYTPRGKVLVGCRWHQDHVSLEVHDTGVGIPEAQQKAIFTEFYQVDGDKRERKDGLGLGLSIVDRIARLLHHPLSLRSIPQRGSSFSLQLPLATLAAADATAQPDQPLPSMLQGQTIAVIENNPDIRLALGTLLGRVGYEVITATSADEVIRSAESKEVIPAAIISDLGLESHENGIDCIARLRQHYDPLLPALLVTGDTSETALTAASRADLLLLHKPVNSEMLLATLSQAIANPYLDKPPPALWPH